MSSHDDPPGRRFGDEDDFDRPPRSDGSNGLATAAIILGVLAICTGPLLGIPALICGILGVQKANRSGGIGHGLALTGLILGVVGCVVPVIILPALLLPAVQKVREAAARTQEMNNLKQLMLGMHNYEAVHNKLPTAYSRGPNANGANRNLSWRVDILPYIEQANLYQLMNLSQPWDSPANAAAAGSLLRVMSSPLDHPPTNGTRYRVFVGPGTAFEDIPAGQKPLSIMDLQDGTANTIFIVDSADMVPWAAPQELPFAPAAPLPALGHPNRQVILVAMGDGVVKTVPKNINPQTLKDAITRSGGEMLPPNW